MPKVLVTEEQWIQLGTEKFSQSGLDGLVIERMSSELGCSKSSFYWYFRNRNEYITKLVERWVELSTNEVILQSSLAINPEDRLTYLLQQMFSATGKGDFLFFFRKLGSNHANFQEMLEKIEQTRIDYAVQVLESMGMTTLNARQKAFILYHYYLGWYERFKNRQVEKDELQQHIDMLKAQLLSSSLEG